MARRIVPLLMVGLLVLGLFVILPGAEASHAWGHRFMVHGQILDAEGDPAQNMLVTISAKSRVEGTSVQPHPQMTIQTDCHGFYYSQATQQGPWDTGLDAGRLHLHPSFPDPQAAWGSNPEFWIATPYADYREDALEPQTPLSEAQIRQYAIHTGDPDHRGKQAAHVNLQLEETLEADPACPEQLEPVFMVRGKVQMNEGRQRVDQVSIEQGGRWVVGPEEVTVTIETTEGPVTETVQTDAAAMYTARFSNVTVAEGARITAEWEGNERTGSADGTYQSAAVDIVPRDWFWQSAGFQILMWLVIAVALAGVVAWGVLRAKDQLETKKAMEKSTRKRSNQ